MTKEILMSEVKKSEPTKTDADTSLAEELPTFIAENPENEDGDVEFLCCSGSIGAGVGGGGGLGGGWS
jgi:hypothetical protein